MSRELRQIRGEIRHWRRGRADTRLLDVLGDAYVALFATAMFGSALVNVVINVRRATGEACVATGCLEARTLLPWVTGLGGVVVVMAMARLFGPVFVSPAVDSWLLTAPLDRAPVLRPRLIGTVVTAAIGSGALAAGAASVATFDRGPLLAFTASAAVLAVVATCLAALAQPVGGVPTRVLTWLLTLGIWVALLVLALGEAPVADPPSLTAAWRASLVAGAVVAVLLLALTIRRLDRLRRRDVSPGGTLAPGISGALATLDLALAYDVVLAHRWHRHDAVRPRRGGPVGPAALLWLDLVRLRRSPQLLVLLAGAAVVPYAAQTAGAGRVVALLAALIGFLAGLPLLGGLRAVTRTASIARAMPFPVATTRMSALGVPVALFGAYGVATTGALSPALGASPEATLWLGLAVGASALASATRWVTGRPPDYSKPLVSTPAGAVPTNLYTSIVRGFDVLVLTTAPVLIWPSAAGATVSLVLSLVVLSYLTGRE